jgi:hypothetical protein
MPRSVNKIQSKWCINKHGASKIIDTFEAYHIFTEIAKEKQKSTPPQQVRGPPQEEHSKKEQWPKASAWAG